MHTRVCITGITTVRITGVGQPTQGESDIAFHHNSFDESRKSDASGDFPWVCKCPKFTSVILVDAVGWVISRTSGLYKNLVIYP